MFEIRYIYVHSFPLLFKAFGTFCPDVAALEATRFRMPAWRMHFTIPTWRTHNTIPARRCILRYPHGTAFYVGTYT